MKDMKNKDMKNIRKKIFLITTMNLEIIYSANDKIDAIKKFFLEIKEGKIPLEEIGLIGFCSNFYEENIAFRIVPTLYALGLISYKECKMSLEQIFKCTKNEIEKWAKEDIEEFRLQEYIKIGTKGGDF
ncbi:MAG: hypothetical protein ACTSRP_07455 [Candidatus Helarchaeota archaeon]